MKFSRKDIATVDAALGRFCNELAGLRDEAKLDGEYGVAVLAEQAKLDVCRARASMRKRGVE